MHVWPLFKSEFTRDRGDVTHYSCANFECEASSVKPVFAIHFTNTWWCHQMKIFSALLALWAGDSPVTGEFPSQRPVTRSFDVLFDLHLNKRLSKQLRRWWLGTPLCSLWRHHNDTLRFGGIWSGTSVMIFANIFSPTHLHSSYLNRVFLHAIYNTLQAPVTI